jgi:hypothetical protein
MRLLAPTLIVGPDFAIAFPPPEKKGNNSAEIINPLPSPQLRPPQADSCNRDRLRKCRVAAACEAYASGRVTRHFP